MFLRIRNLVAALALAAALSTTSGCFAPSPSSGGGQVKFTGKRAVNPADVVLPPGFRIEAVAEGLTFPTGVTFDDQGRAYVVESGYVYGEKWTTPRLLRIEANGSTAVVVTGSNPPWNGVAFHKGAFYIAEGGARNGGRIVRVGQNGRDPKVLVDKLPSVGDHHTNGPAIGPDGFVYFGQGTATNSGVVGTDNAKFGWLARHPEFHDIPARDIRLVGHNFTTDNPLTKNGKGDKAHTGAFLPFGTESSPRQLIRGNVRCTGAVLRVKAEGGEPEVVAWGMRNPFGLAFAPDGTLYVTENSYDVRGSRPVWGSGDVLWKIGPGERGKWFGWPDFHGNTPLTKSDQYGAAFRKRAPKFLLAEHPNEPPQPVVKFGVHASSNGLAFSRNPAFGYEGQAFVAQFGDMAPTVGKVVAPVGFNVVRVDVKGGTIDTFAANRGKDAPASRLKRGGFERPVDVEFNPDGSALYVVDFGVVSMTKKGPTGHEGTGVLWRITREGTR